MARSGCVEPSKRRQWGIETKMQDGEGPGGIIVRKGVGLDSGTFVSGVDF
jgi:hypothetical protein